VIGTLHSQYKLDFFERTKSKIITEIALKEMIRTFNQCDELWAVNQRIAEIYSDDGTYSMPRVQHNATDMIPFKDDVKENALKKQYNIKNDERILLYVGRLDLVKNLDFMLESLYRLRLKGFKFRMIFVGSGPYEKEMQSLVKKYGLTDKTIFAGRITDRIELSMHYKIADLFLFPSIYDSSSLVQIEAASQKTPTLFLRDTATSSTVTENVNGFFSEHDPLQYAEKIMEIFKNQKLYLKVKEQCFRDLYVTWSDVTEEVFQRYLSLIEQKRTSSRN
jgi:glycosyltransferase involved in cell wall biosynthesis